MSIIIILCFTGMHSICCPTFQAYVTKLMFVKVEIARGLLKYLGNAKQRPRSYS